MYTETNFKSKKALKEAIAKGDKVRVYQPNDMFGVTSKVAIGEHQVSLEGPHYPEAHRWYGTGKVVDGILIGVK